MKRVLCLCLPYLATDRLKDHQQHGDKPQDNRTPHTKWGTGAPSEPPTPSGGTRCAYRKALHNAPEAHKPTVVVAPASGGLRVVCADVAALRGGVRQGCTLADASALLADLESVHQDTVADRTALEALAVWAECLSPVVHVEGDAALLVDVTGCQRLFGGEDKLIDRAVAGVRGQGFCVRAAIADTPGAAWALAHADGRDAVIAAPGGTAAAMARLPVWSLRVDDKTCTALRRLGVETIEALLHLPRSSMAARLGDALLHRLDQALGDAAEPLIGYRPPPAVRAGIRFAPTDRQDVLREAVDRCLASLCDQLARQTAGVRQIHVTFYLHEAGQHTLDLQLARATRRRAHLRSLFDVRLGELRLRHPVAAIAVWSRQVEGLDDVQQEWFETDDADRAGLADLMDRLAIRLGRDRVVRPKVVDEHQPELAYRYVSVLDGEGKSAARQAARGVAAPARPLRLLVRPVRVPVMAVVPDGPPVRFRWEGREMAVVAFTGPERLETGWWRGPPVRRDYYHVKSDTLCHYWLFRTCDNGMWYMHGVFD